MEKVEFLMDYHNFKKGDKIKLGGKTLDEYVEKKIVKKVSEK